MRQSSGLTRRGILLLASGAGAQSFLRLYAGDSAFWNKKDPAEWSPEEISRLANNSPWAKEITVLPVPSQRDYAGSGGGRGNAGVGGPGMGPPNPSVGGGAPGMGGGGMGAPGMGGGGGGRGRGAGGDETMTFKGVVRWESAKPLQESLKTPLPEAFANHYVISVSGIPILGQGRQHSAAGDAPTTVSKGLSPEVLDRIKDLTYLEPKGKPPAQPGVVDVSSAITGFTKTLLFGFSRETLPLSPEDKEVTFKSELGNLQVHARFNLKDMMYHKELAL